MSIALPLDRILSRRPRVALQTEAAECGLACLATILSYHHHKVELATLRNRFPISMKGTSLQQLIKLAEKLNLASRPVSLDLPDMDLLRLPCVLHWRFNHYVVLLSVGRGGFEIADPTRGIRTVTHEEMSRSFTGVALEVWPNQDFKPHQEPSGFPLSALFRGATGWSSALLNVGVLALCLETVALISPYFIKLVVDTVIVARDLDFLWVLAIGFGLLLLVQQSLSAMRAWMLVYLSTSVSFQWRSNVFSHMLNLPINYFQRRTLGDIVSRFASLDSIQRTLTGSFIEGVLDGLMSAATLAVMFFFNPFLAAITLATTLIFICIRLAWLPAQKAASEEQLIHGAQQHTHFLESIRGVRTLKLFLRQADRRADWIALLANQTNADVVTQRLSLRFRIINATLFGLENIIIISLAAHAVINAGWTVGALFAFLAYKSQFSTRVSSFIERAIEFRMLSVQVNRLGDLVLADVEPAGTGDVEPTVEGAALELRVEKLSYRYAEHEPWILHDLSFCVAAGESVAIVGPSGCGKTTLMNVIVGFLEPTAGKVYIGGQDVRTLGVNGARSFIGAVLQDDVLFAGSIADNISFFAPKPDLDWVRECARRACILDDVEAMPMGFNTLVGDMGTVLSGGQKQRVVLARALYKRPKLLVLDEATSHLDVTTERSVNEAVRALDITRIIIAHRPETIASADRVLELSPPRTQI